MTPSFGDKWTHHHHHGHLLALHFCLNCSWLHFLWLDANEFIVIISQKIYLPESSGCLKSVIYPTTRDSNRNFMDQLAGEIHHIKYKSWRNLSFLLPSSFFFYIAYTQVYSNKLQFGLNVENLIHYKKAKKNDTNIIIFSSVAQCVPLFAPHGLRPDRLPWPSPTSRISSNSCPLSWWCHGTISPFLIPFSSRLQSYPASGSVPMSQLFASGGQSIGVSASASIPPMNIQDWFPLGWTYLMSFQSKGLSRVFSNTKVKKHNFFSAQLSSWSNSNIHASVLEKP